MDISIVGHRENQKYTFHGSAVDEIRKALVLGLVLSCETDRARNFARENAASNIPDDCLPVMPDDDCTGQIANALLWLEMTGCEIDTSTRD